MDEQLLNQNQSEDKDSLQFPGFTEWRGSKCLCCKIFKIPLLHQLFCGHWEVRPFFPIIFLMLSITSMIMLGIFVLPYFEIEGAIMLFVELILFFMYLLSYFRIIYDGPGYYPFYYGTQYKPPENEIISPNDENNSPSGIISNDQQLEWCTQRNEQPPRSILSKTARRFVLRPEHYSIWASSWIGKRNHKFFILHAFYGMLYLGIFVIYTSRRLTELFNDSFSIVCVVLSILCVLAAVFFLVLLSYFISNIINISVNRTTWEQWNDVNVSSFNTGLCSNIEDVFGSRKHFYCWICPSSPWVDKSNDDIMQSYFSYNATNNENIPNCFE